MIGSFGGGWWKGRMRRRLVSRLAYTDAEPSDPELSHSDYKCCVNPHTLGLPIQTLFNADFPHTNTSDVDRRSITLPERSDLIWNHRRIIRYRIVRYTVFRYIILRYRTFRHRTVFPIHSLPCQPASSQHVEISQSDNHHQII